MKIVFYSFGYHRTGVTKTRLTDWLVDVKSRIGGISTINGVQVREVINRNIVIPLCKFHLIYFYTQTDVFLSFIYLELFYKRDVLPI